MYQIINTISNSVVAISGDKDIATQIFEQVDTMPSTHEIVEVADVNE